MKKLTGYIGAMIIVFALMGSILLGYALDINGTTEVINKYDGVTDVSGLYSYSDEKSYTDYNPASNYINYLTTGKYDNSGITGYLTFKNFKGGSHTFIFEKETVTIDGIVQGAMIFNPVSYHLQFISEKLYVQYTPVADINRLYVYGENTATHYNKITLTVTGSTISYNAITTANVTVSGSVSVNNDSYLSYYSGDDWDYIQLRMYNNPNITDAIPAYYSDEYPIFSGGFANGLDIIAMNENVYKLGDNSFTTMNLYVDTDEGYGVYHTGDIRYGDAYETAIPKYVYYYGVLGIDYTESNRVNNYPTSQYSETRTTTTNQFDLSSMTGILTNYAPADEQVTGRNLIIGRTPDFTPPNNSLATDITWSWPNTYRTYNFLLADIINSQAIPATTYKIKITFNSSSYSTFDGLLTSAHLYKNFDINTACLNYNDWFVDTVANYNTTNNKILEVNDVFGEKDYVIYDPSTGIIDIYNYLDVKIATRSAYNTYVTCAIYDNSIMTGTWDGLFWYSTFSNSYSKNRYIQTNPMISSGGNTNLVTATYYQMSSTPATYMDVTKGVKINSSNISDTIWNNEYENGDVQIVFRSESIGNNYTNQIQTMTGDIITVDYTDSKYYVAINSEEAVEIGNWRNIVLDLDFNHDTVTVYPVKTFNSFIDVIVYNTPINIGKITHTDNTQLKWLPTANSLMFSVFKTSVFMDTYGVVMVNPSLNITNYFTDLNQFYRLKIYNFSVYGDDMTINGITGTVTGNNITFDETTILLNEMYVTYADGHVYIEDSYSSVDLGEITTTDVTMTGAWYFQTFLEKGYTSQKYVYDWDWSTFILDNTEFCIFYIGIALAGLIIARKFCSLSIIDYVIFITSIVLALSIQVIA